MDCDEDSLVQLDLLSREVFLPLLCSEEAYNNSAQGANSDRLMDMLHRLMASVEVIQGHTMVCWFQVEHPWPYVLQAGEWSAPYGAQAIS